MKPKHIIILIICILFVVGGLAAFVWGAKDAASDVQRDEAQDSITGTAQASAPELSAAASPALHYPDLDHANLPDGTPSVEKSYTGFRVSFNPDNRNPNWSAWELLGEETTGPSSRSNKFWTDERVPNCPSTKDYARSGYDRGHLCPAADQKWSQEAMEDCFVMTNISPQDHALNAGAWNTLEAKERQWAKRDSAIVIIAGPILSLIHI